VVVGLHLADSLHSQHSGLNPAWKEIVNYNFNTNAFTLFEVCKILIDKFSRVVVHC
jgi:hypothetical protein